MVLGRGGGGGRRGAGVHGAQGGGLPVVAAEAGGGALREAGDPRPALPLLHRLRPGDGRPHARGIRQANDPPELPQHPSPRALLLPPMEENLR